MGTGQNFEMKIRKGKLEYSLKVNGSEPIEKRLLANIIKLKKTNFLMFCDVLFLHLLSQAPICDRYFLSRRFELSPEVQVSETFAAKSFIGEITNANGKL